MLGFIKNLFKKRSIQEPASSHAIPLPVAPPAAPPAPAVAPAPSEAAPPLPAARPRSRNKMERVLLPLKTITDAFPEALQPLVAETPEPTVMIALPVDRIVAQLPTGRVEVAIGQLRRVAPATIFIAETDWDEQMVEIPLRELLPKLDPTLLKRRTQRKIDLPLDEDVFQRRGATTEAPESDGLGMTLEAATEDDLAEAEPVVAPPRPVAMPVPVASAVPVAPAAPATSVSAPRDLHALFGSAAPAPKAPPVAPPAPVAASAPAAPSPISLRLKPEPLAPTPVAPSASTPVAPVPTAPQEPPVIRLGGQPKAPPVVPAAPAAAPISLKLAETAPAPATVNPLNPLSLSAQPAAPRGAVVHLPLQKVAGQWPEAIREEISGLGEEARIEYPLEPLGVLLKRGKVAAQWKDLRSWIPALHNSPSLYDDALLELPLPVVAPLFMVASGGRQAPQKKAVVDESIPSPFTPAAMAPAAPEAPAPAAAPAPEASIPVSTPAVAVNSKPMGALGLDEAIPATLIERACSLSGVAGSVIALKDGLLVAAKTPGEFKAETIAAFMPQVFSRVESAAGSMQIGEFQTLMFTAGDRPWQIWKAGGLFFAAIGKPNELLPSAQLKIIAGQLARQTR